MRGRLPKTGTFAGTGAALNVSVGFRPVCVLFYNETDGISIGFAADGQADAKGLKVVDSGSGTTDLSFVSSAGITITSTGFSVGTDADMNISGKTYRYVAF